MSYRLNIARALLLGVCTTMTAAPRAHAELSGTQKAAAEAAFQAGVDLMAADKAAEACAKFESSQQMDPALGTMLRLADCYETINKTASAWALFVEARSAAAVSGRADRESIAAERANSLAQRLTKIELQVQGKVDREELKINGVLIPSGSWDAPLPVDPGKLHVEVSAPGYLSWSGDYDAPPGPSTLKVSVPLLSPAPSEPVPLQPRPTLPAPTPSAERPGSALRTIGLVTGTVGLGGVALGGLFAAQAYSKNQDSLKECRKGDPNACNENGVGLRNDARTAGTRATIAFVAGGALLAAGVTLFVLAPSRHESQALFHPRLRKVKWLGTAGVAVQGEF